MNDMEGKELMIGDWVCLIKDYGKLVEDILKISALDLHRIDDGMLEVKPIPLTQEILEKIGFEAQPNIGYIIDNWDGTQIIYDRWNHNLRIIKNYKTCLDIETFNDVAVHELQHALRLCGFEKEIEL